MASYRFANRANIPDAWHPSIVAVPIKCGTDELGEESVARIAGMPVMICLLGRFRLLKFGHPMTLRGRGKIEALLCILALEHEHTLSREAILDRLWPNAEPALAGQSLNTLIYSLHKLVGDAIGAAAPVVYIDGGYRLNVAAGIAIDLEEFEALAIAGDRLACAGAVTDMVVAYRHAATLYRGDLCESSSLRAIVEGERLRALYLTLLSRLTDHFYSLKNYSICLDLAWQLLTHDPCREDAHRMMMRCLVRLGARIEALRQFQLCEKILSIEFNARPESVTTELFDQIRLNPGSI